LIKHKARFKHAQIQKAWTFKEKSRLKKNFEELPIVPERKKVLINPCCARYSERERERERIVFRRGLSALWFLKSFQYPLLGELWSFYTFLIAGQDVSLNMFLNVPLINESC
jgi:hypothetical protein